MSAIVVDSSMWPLVRIVYPPSFDDADYRKLIARLNELLDRKQPFVLLQDTRGGGTPNAVQRKLTTEWYVEREAALKQYVRGSAMIVQSAAVRGVITALLWVKPPPFAATTTATEGEAFAYLRRVFPEGGSVLR